VVDTSASRLTTLPRLEVGFGYFGATIALVGTLRTLNHDQFIEEMRARVIRKTDHSRHEFKWAVFRPAVSLLPPKIEELQVAMGFLLSASTPKAVSIQLHDTATRSRADQNLAQLRNEFAKYLMNNKILIRDVVPSERVALYKKFSEAHHAAVTKIWTDFDRSFYWEPGQYELNVEISTSHPTKIYSFSYTFVLTPPDSELLRANTVYSMLAACEVPDVVFNFAYCELVETTLGS